MPPRKKAKAASAIAGDSTAIAVADNRQPGRAVRRRTASGKGSLQNLPDFAVEIQLELFPTGEKGWSQVDATQRRHDPVVFSHLHPRDLLNLSRACKLFRAFFLHISNERLWKAAREGIDGLPERPPYLSEPVFANLLFGTCCQNCGQTNIRKVAWAWFARYCPKCVLARSYSLVEALDKIKNIDRHHIYTDILLMMDILPIYCAQEVLELQRLRVQKSPIDMLTETLRSAGSPIPDGMRSEWVAMRKQEMTERKKYVSQGIYWYERQETDRAANLDAKRVQRFTEIVARLRRAGWDKEIDFLGPAGLEEMASLPVVRQSSKLTPKSWEKVLGAVDKFLNETRRRRLTQERLEVLRLRFCSLNDALLSHYVQLPRRPNMDCRPEYVDIAFMNECKALADVPSSETVTLADFEAAIPALVVRWEEERRKELTDALQPHLPSLSPDTDPLSLAIAVFPCRCDRNSLRTRTAFYHYPAIFAHPCPHTQKHHTSPFLERDNYIMAATDPYSDSFWTRRYPFALERMRSSPKILAVSIKAMRNIVAALRLDPARATVDDLQSCERRVRCTDCQRSGLAVEQGKAKVYSWDAALQHVWSHPFFTHERWEAISAKDMEAVRKIESEAHPGIPSLSTIGSIWACLLCFDWDGKADEVKEHLMSQHDITYSDQCIQSSTIYLHPGKSAALLRPAIVLPSS